MFLIESNELSLPSFTLNDESWADRLGQKVFRDDIDFEHNPLFSKKYTLRGEPKEDVQKVFSTDILQFFETKELGKFEIEARGTFFLFYRPKRTLSPKKIENVMNEVIELLSKFKKSTF